MGGEEERREVLHKDYVRSILVSEVQELQWVGMLCLVSVCSRNDFAEKH